MRRLLAILAALSITSSATLAAQQPTPQDSTRRAVLSVYLDCPNVGCDEDFFQTDITAVNWVRDRAGADVHILVTGQDTGGGGREFTTTFIGLRQFAGLVDTLHQVLPAGFSDDDRRKMLARLFRAGLVRYFARTSAADKMTVSFGAAGAAKAADTRKDPWHSWVFQAGLFAFGNSEQRNSSTDRNANFNANRVTKAMKTELSWYRSLSKSESEFSDGTKYKYSSGSYGISTLNAKSLGEHWSAGIRGSLSSSKYDNFKRVWRVTPAIEYNVFPYSASTRRQLRIEYNAGYASYTYHDTTISDKIAEDMPIHRLAISVNSSEPWGSIRLGSNGVGYLNGGDNYRLGVFGGASIKLFKGFNINFNGNYQSIHDQFFLTKNSFTQQEILTHQYQLPTNYRFWGYMEISYTFGSIFSTVVNPRFNGGFD